MVLKLDLFRDHGSKSSLCNFSICFSLYFNAHLCLRVQICDYMGEGVLKSMIPIVNRATMVIRTEEEK